MPKSRSSLCLVALDIQGEWNLPLLRNAAELSQARLLYATSGTHEGLAVPESISFEESVRKCSKVFACETGVRARNIFDLPAPRENTALVVGNEEHGIAKSVLKQCTSTITIPMFSRRLSSINVAASGAVALYVLSRDLARKSTSVPRSRSPSLDLLIRAPDSPAECGSLLRSAAAFGWKTVYLADPAQSWFTTDHDRLGLSRGAARREANPIVVLEADKLRSEQYSHVIWCAEGSACVPLSRYRPSHTEKALVVLGECDLPSSVASLPCDRVRVDFLNTGVQPCPRHEGSTALAVLAQQIWRSSVG